MKKSELANLTIGTKIISKKDESIHEVLEVTENYVQLGERAYSKSTIQRWYNIYTEPVVEEKPVERKIEIVEPIYNEQQIITDTKHLENYFVKSIIPKTNIEGNMEYEYTLINMHNNEEIIVAEVTIEAFFVLTTNEWNEKVQQAHKPVEEKPVEVVPEDKTSTVEEKEHIEDQLNVLSVSLTNVLNYCEEMNCTLKQNSNHIAVKYCNKNVMEIHPTKRKGICAVVRHTLFTDDEIKQLKDAKIIGAGTYVIDLKFRIESMEQFKDILGTAIYCK